MIILGWYGRSTGEVREN